MKPLPPQSSENFEQYVRRLAKERGLSLDVLAHLAGFTRGTLYNLFNDNNPRLSHLLKLSQAMDVHHYHLMRLKWREFDRISPNLPHAHQDASGFVDETVPDGSLFAPEAVFDKSWTIQNIGDTVWQNRYLVNVDEPCAGQHPSGFDWQCHRLVPDDTVLALPTVYPSQICTVSVRYTAPSMAGRYVSYWRMVDETGKLCYPNGIGLSVCILVKNLGVAVQSMTFSTIRL